jgi:hypothetical protein
MRAGRGASRGNTCDKKCDTHFDSFYICIGACQLPIHVLVKFAFEFSQVDVKIEIIFYYHFKKNIYIYLNGSIE